MQEKIGIENETAKNKATLDTVVSFLKRLMPDNSPFIEMQNDTLLISGVMAFTRNIRDREVGIFNTIKESPYFKDVAYEDGILSISATLKTPIGKVKKILFVLEKDM